MYITICHYIENIDAVGIISVSNNPNAQKLQQLIVEYYLHCLRCFFRVVHTQTKTDSFGLLNYHARTIIPFFSTLSSVSVNEEQCHAQNFKNGERHEDIN